MYGLRYKHIRIEDQQLNLKLDKMFGIEITTFYKLLITILQKIGFTVKRTALNKLKCYYLKFEIQLINYLAKSVYSRL